VTRTAIIVMVVTLQHHNHITFCTRFSVVNHYTAERCKISVRNPAEVSIGMKVRIHGA